MVFGRRGMPDGAFPKQDAGRGSLGDYRFDLLPTTRNVRMRLAGCDPHQDLIADIAGAETLECVVSRRTIEEERADAPMPVRLFADGRLVGPVGQVPRGLEGVVNEAVTRLELAGRTPRIPGAVVPTRHGLRVELLMGATR